MYNHVLLNVHITRPIVFRLRHGVQGVEGSNPFIPTRNLAGLRVKLQTRVLFFQPYFQPRRWKLEIHNESKWCSPLWSGWICVYRAEQVHCGFVGVVGERSPNCAPSPLCWVGKMLYYLNMKKEILARIIGLRQAASAALLASAVMVPSQRPQTLLACYIAAMMGLFFVYQKIWLSERVSFRLSSHCLS